MATPRSMLGRFIAVVGALGAPAAPALFVGNATAIHHVDAPPEFAPEFRLNYTVTNLQFGFVAVGMWFVKLLR